MKAVITAAMRSCAEVASRGPTRLGGPARYALAISLIALATLARLAIAPAQSGLPYITYFPAATLAAILGGIGPAILATGLGAALAGFLFIPPHFAFTMEAEALVSGLVFVADEAIVCSAIAAMRRFYRNYLSSLSDLETAHAAERHARIEAEKANAAKSRFLAAASHDLRQPYQALRLFHATLQAPNLPPDTMRAVVDNMEVAISAGEGLLQALLDISTLDAGVVVPRPAEIAAADILADLAARHAPIARSKGLRLRVVGRDRRLVTDPVLLARILDNLVANAIRYTEEGGILVACRRRADATAFEVWDSGIGIAPEHSEAIFQEFFQVANGERDRSKGVGLGLAVVTKTAHLLGLPLSMKSRLGHGTLFRLVVPAAA